VLMTTDSELLRVEPLQGVSPIYKLADFVAPTLSPAPASMSVTARRMQVMTSRP
jgi:hypothetical protein